VNLYAWISLKQAVLHHWFVKDL